MITTMFVIIIWELGMAAVVYVIRVLILIIIFNDKGLVGEVREKGKGKNREKVGGNIEKGWGGRKGGCMGGENKWWWNWGGGNTRGIK